MNFTELSQTPLRLVPNRLCRMYPGGREIESFRGNAGAGDDLRPEAWVGSTTLTCHNGDSPDEKFGYAQVCLENGARPYLKDLIMKDPEAFLGSKHVAKFGEDTAILVKLLDAEKQLGLQCHPDRQAAKKYFNSNYGKIESWYVIGLREDQDEEPYLLLGFKEGITREKFTENYLTKNIKAQEFMCHKIKPTVGDMYFVDAGVPHAIGPGCFVIETQEPSDITLGAIEHHFGSEQQDDEKVAERTIGSYHFVGRSYEDNLRTYQVKSTKLSEEPGGIESLLLGGKQTPYFSMTRVDVNSRMNARDTGTFSIGIVIGGKGNFEFRGGKFKLKKGDEIFIPAGVKDVIWVSDEGPLSVVRCYPPEIF